MSTPKASARAGLGKALAVLLGMLLVVAAVGLLLTFTWRAELPDPVATHWGTDGPDGFTSRAVAVWLPLLAPVIALLVGLPMLLMNARTAMVRRAANGLAVGVAAFVTGIVVMALGAQRGLTDAADVDVNGPILVGLLAGFVLGGIAAALTPGSRPGAVAHEPIPEDARRAALPDGAVAAWNGWTAMPAIMLVGAAFVVIPVILAALGVMPWVVALIGLLTALLVVSMSSFRVTAGVHGLQARSVLGWPTLRVPLAEIVEARVATAHPMRDFGGWGLRMGKDGKYGVVLRKGEAIEVERGDGSTAVVTVDGATDAVALLNTLAERARVPAPK